MKTTCFDTALAALERTGAPYELFPPGSPQSDALGAAFERAVPMAPFAHIDWTEATDTQGLSQPEHPVLFDKVAQVLRSWCDTHDTALVVLPFNGSEPTLRLGTKAALPVIEPLLEVYPLWIVAFEPGWVLEWRRSGEATTGYFTKLPGAEPRAF